MSCESRHRAMVATLLTLAGLHDTVPADDVMSVGVANRRRRGELPTPDAAVTVSLHADAQHALEITGHSDHATPAWVAALIDRLHTAAERGSRRALLTLRWLTGGWEEVTPIITEDDRAWIMIATRCGIRIPPACEARVMATRPSVADVGRHLTTPVRDTIVMMEILDALRGIDDVSPDAVQTVTPPQVLRFLFGGSFPSRTDRQRTLRAVLEHAPVVRETITWLDTMGWDRTTSLLAALIGRAVCAQGCSAEQAGGDAMLSLLAGWIRQAGGPAVSRAALRNPSPSVVEAIAHFLQRRRSKNPRLVGLSLAALLRIWQTSGRDDAVEEVIRCLGQTRDKYWSESFGFTFSTTVAAIVAGAIRPPHGDALTAYLGVASDVHDAWSSLTAGAIYAAACQSIGHVPIVAGIETLIRNQWGKVSSLAKPSSIPLLAVGCEQKLLVPALYVERDPTRRAGMLHDLIDAMDMIDTVGGDPRRLQNVLADVLTDGSGAIDPQIMIRLAASPCGQAVLSLLPTVVPPPPIGTEKERAAITLHLIPHLASPWWATAPPHLREWWETTIERVAASRFGTALAYPPPLYPTVEPRAAVMYPHPILIARAVAHRQWATLPDADRRACLEKTFRTMYLGDLLQVVVNAATTTALQDIAAAVTHADSLSDTDKDFIRRLIEPDAWGGQHEL